MTDIDKSMEILSWRIKDLAEKISKAILTQERNYLDEYIDDICICIDIYKKLKEVKDEPK